jgi:uncharacterized repeat protein (TIGR01451 family)
MMVDGAAASLSFAGGSPTSNPQGAEPLAGVTNYLTGNDPSHWRIDVPQYRKAVYAGVYPAIDVVYYGDGTTLEFDLNIHPGADPRAIRLAYGGVTGLHITKKGDLAFSLGDREVVQRKPVAYQQRAGRQVPVTATYRIADGANEVALEVGPYDRSQVLVIDPVLQYGTFFGGTGLDGANALAVDSSGNAYITGYTQSPNLPRSSSSPFQGGLNGPGDAFVAKINAAGTALIYTTYLGGSGNDQGAGIAVDSAGDIYISGETTSTDFPIVGIGPSNGLSTTYQGGNTDGFVSVLNSSGNFLVFSGYLGGSGDDVARALTLDGNGNIYVTGYTNSTTLTGITSESSQPANAGGYDAFITKLTTTGAILYCTFFGGSGDDQAYGIALDSTGNPYIAGQTTSPSLPSSSTLRHGSQDAFVAEFSASSGSPIAAMNIGGSAIQSAFALAIDSSNEVYLTGTTTSTDFPVTAPLQASNGGGYDAFVTTLQPNSGSPGWTVVFSTFLGGSGDDAGYSIAVAQSGNIYVAGYTESSNFLPGLPSQPAPGPNTFVVKLAPAGNESGAYSPAFATYLAGCCPSVQIYPVSLALRPGTSSEDVFFAGYADSSFSFPVPPLFPYGGGSTDAFIARLGQANLSISATLGPYVGTNVPGTGSIVPGTTALTLVAVSNSGPDDAANVTVTVQLPPGVTFVRCQSDPTDSSQAPPTCSASGSTVTVTSALLAAGSNLAVQVLAGTTSAIGTGGLNLTITLNSSTNNSNPNTKVQAFAVTGGILAFTVGAGNLDFGSAQLGQSVTKNLVITPNQPVSLNLILTPDNGVSPTVFTLAPGVDPNPNLDANPANIVLVFQPQSTGSVGGNLDIIAKDLGQTISSSLEGEGTTVATSVTILPQFAFGGGWYSALYFTNLTNAPVSFPLNLVSDDGTPLNVPALAGATTTVTLPAYETGIIEAPNLGSVVQQGYALFTLPSGVYGYGVFRQSVPGRADQEAVVPFSTASATSNTLTWDDTNFTTAVAIVNPSSTSTTVAVTLQDSSGNIMTSSVSLPPNQKRETPLRSLPGLEAMVGRRGSAQFTVSSGNVAVLGLRFNESAFTSIPAVDPASVISGSIVLPQFAFGGGWYSALYFTNLTGAAASFPVSFTSDAGTPLTIPALGGASTQVNLQAHGTVIVEAPNTGNLTQGYAMFTLTAGVYGYGVFRQSVSGSPNQEAVVPFSSAGATSNTLTWDDTNRTTSVAIVNPSSSTTTVAITLRDSNGNMLTSSVQLPPNQKIETQLRSLPGLAGMAGQRGTAHFTVTTGNVAVLGLRFGDQAFTSIPAMNP